MYLIVIVWTYVTLMMAVAEATSPVGTVLGAIITFLLYGALPMGILVYILGTPSRKRKIKAREAAEQAAYDAQQQRAAGSAQPADAGPGADGQTTAATASDATHVANVADAATSIAPDAGSETPAAAQGSAVAAVRKEP